MAPVLPLARAAHRSCPAQIHGGGRKASASSRTKSAAQSFTGQGALLLALKQENEALRKELAKYQQVPADQVPCFCAAFAPAAWRMD